MKKSEHICQWVASAVPGYEFCAVCKAQRKAIVHTLPPVQPKPKPEKAVQV